MTFKMANVLPFVGNEASKRQAWRTLGFLVLSGAATRFAVGLSRVYMNLPFNNHTEASKGSKTQALFERIFIELFGTAGYVLSLAFGQDVVANYLERRGRWSSDFMSQTVIDNMKRDNIPFSSPREKTVASILHPVRLGNNNSPLPFTPAAQKQLAPEAIAIRDAFREVYKHQGGGVFQRVIYSSDESYMGKVKDLLNGDLKSQWVDALDQQFYPKVVPYLDDLNAKLSSNASRVILGGLISGAVFGGIVFQYLNDFAVSPLLSRMFNSADTSPSKKGQQPTWYPATTGLGRTVPTLPTQESPARPTSNSFSSPSYYTAFSSNVPATYLRGGPVTPW